MAQGRGRRIGPAAAEREQCRAPTNGLRAQPLTTLPGRKSVIAIIFHELNRKVEEMVLFNNVLYASIFDFFL